MSSNRILGRLASKQQVAMLAVIGDLNTLKFLDYSHFTEADFEFVFQKLAKRMENPYPDEDGFEDSMTYKLAYNAHKWLTQKKALNLESQETLCFNQIIKQTAKMNIQDTRK
jgi:hypothetical protein